MRIISKFKDYYDTAAAYGIDKEILYIRESKKITLPEIQDIKIRLNSYIDGYEVEKRVVGFCGDLHMLMVLHPTIGTSYRRDLTRSPVYCYTKEDLMKYYDIPKKHVFWRKRLDMFFETKQFDNQLKELFQKLKIPVFMTFVGDDRKTYIDTAPILKDVEFYRVKDSATAFQDIFQYVAGVLGSPEREMIQISDKDKLHKKGFDKWSFKKLPSKK